MARRIRVDSNPHRRRRRLRRRQVEPWVLLLQRLFLLIVAVVILTVDTYNIWKTNQQATVATTPTAAEAAAKTVMDQPHKQESPSSNKQRTTKSTKIKTFDNSTSSATPSTTKSIITRPLQVLLDYQKRHSQEVLQREYEQNNGAVYNRTFVIGFYACPDSAGNRLHEFFYSFLQAMIHDYTILWKFFDATTCRNVGTAKPSKWCNFPGNSIEACAQLVNRAPWMASYDEWAVKLKLTYGRRGKNEHWYSDGFDSVNTSLDYNLQKYPPIPNGNKVWLPKEVNHVVDMKSDYLRRDSKTAAADRLDELYSLGAYFVNGMVFREIFPFHDNVLPPPLPTTSSRPGSSNNSQLVVGGDNNKKEISILLHSRHVKIHNDGSNVANETRCLQQILNKHKKWGTKYDTCHFLLVSDRNATIENLKAFISQNTSCIPVTAKHTAMTATTHDGNTTTTNNNNGGDRDGYSNKKESAAAMFLEHGPFALSGFFRDLALVGQYANGGYIGASRTALSSSADLFRDLYEYNHVMMNIMETNNTRAIAATDTGPPVFCYIPKHK